MGKVVAGATVSLDGYIAGPNESGFEHLFAWFDGGDVEFPSVDPNFHARLSEPDYRYMRDFVEGIGVFRDRAPDGGSRTTGAIDRNASAHGQAGEHSERTKRPSAPGGRAG